MSFDGFVKPLFELLRQPLRYSVAIGIVVAIVLFSPDSVVNKLGMLKYRNEGKPYFGVILLLCIALTIASGIGALGSKINDYRLRRSRKKRLHSLTVEEKQILRAYIKGQTRTRYFDITDGVVKGLEQETIIYRSSDVGHLVSGFAYNIQPWAWNYLNDHRDLLGL
ncbi:MAG TPA: superinfection exclusion B family protein [Alphaproteobacteria bacterium]|nr:superinfection exclusion B family protein [Alphaproteobacteria bacterium]